MDDAGLRTARLGHQGTEWTKQEILLGLTHFFKLHGRYPTAHEIDKFEYLPSSRSIQRKYGGLVTLRKELVPDSHSNYTQGVYRSEMASKTYKRAALYEEEFYKFLCENFEPISIHEHKIIRPGNVASDYFLYINEKQGIVIDLFYAQDIFSLGGIINIKLRRYSSLPFKIIFISVGNDELDIEIVKSYLARRKLPMPKNILLDTEDNFKKSTINSIKKLSDFSKSSADE